MAAASVAERHLGNVFVTGGSGFVGRELIRQLLEVTSSEGIEEVRASCRSGEAQACIERLGGDGGVVRAWPGDLTSVERLVEGMRGCDTVFHCAASVAQFGDWDSIYDINVAATRRVIVAARRAGVRALVHVSTEAVLVGDPIVNADERQPYSAHIDGMYPRSKRMAEEIVLEEAGNTEQPLLVVVRPRFVWGKDDSTILPAFVQTARSGQFKWFGADDYLTSTCHVSNVVEGLLKAAKHGRHGSIYFVTDGPPQSYRAFVTRLLATQDVDASHVASVPRWLVAGFAATSQFFHGLVPALGTPTIVPATLRLIGEEVTVSDAKARQEIHYEARVTIDQGMDELRRNYQAANLPIQ